MIDERVENGEDVAAVFDDALEDGAELGLAGCFAIPFGQDSTGILMSRRSCSAEWPRRNRP